MTSTRRWYFIMGLGLLFAGAALFSVSYTILRSIPLTALGISAVILGVVSLALGRVQPKISSEAMAALLESSLENFSALLEELGLKSKAVYLPSSMTNGQPQALIPLRLNPNPPKPETPLPRRLIVKYGPNPEDLGLLMTTPGSIIMSMLGSKPSSAPADIESALSLVLTGITDIAESVNVTMNEERILVEVSKPSLKHGDARAYACLGSPIASIAASIVAEALSEPIIVNSEENKKDKVIIELKVLR